MIVYLIICVGEGLDPPYEKFDLDGRIFRKQSTLCADFTPSRCEIHEGRVKTRPYRGVPLNDHFLQERQLSIAKTVIIPTLQSKAPGADAPGADIHFQRPSGYNPWAVFSRRAATTTGLSAA